MTTNDSSGQGKAAYVGSTLVYLWRSEVPIFIAGLILGGLMVATVTLGKEPSMLKVRQMSENGYYMHWDSESRQYLWFSTNSITKGTNDH